MRFLKLFFGLVVVGLVVLTVWYYGKSEIVLFKASRSLQRDMRQLLVKAINRESSRTCAELRQEFTSPSRATDQSDESKKRIIEAYQLRFTSMTEYVLEVDCQQEGAQPIELAKNSLPDGVEKVRGSGVLFQSEREGLLNTSVVLAYRDRLMAVGFRDGTVASWRLTGTPAWQLAEEQQPATSCEAWGYYCCESQLGMGMGNKIESDKLTSCQKDCYEACNQRPVLVYFNSDPVADPRNRMAISYESKPTVQFGYQVEDFDSSEVKVSIDYGDGEIHEYLPAAGLLNHQYQCLRDECSYSVRIQAMDETGLTMADSGLQTLTIVVRPN